MTRQDSDILEVKLLDNSYQLLFKTRARLKDKKEMDRMVSELRFKGVKLFDNKGWFD